ncbi:INTS8 family protein [Megaselia abdita]
MDDLLVIKSIPLSKETILWFEFLLNPALLQKHLEKKFPEPTELLNQFLNMAPDLATNVFDINHLTEADSSNSMPVTPGGGGSNGKFKMLRKQLAVKILGLKVATFLKWNLDILEQQLTVPKQICLLKDLCIISFGKNVNIPLHSDFTNNVAPEGSEKAAEFALIMYHRWVLRLQLIKDIAIKNIARPLIPNLILATDQMQQCFAPDIPVKPSVDYLVQILQSSEPFFIFTFDTLLSPDQNSEIGSQNFDKMKRISSEEVKAQIYYDLTNYYVFSNQYQKAKESIIECEKNYLEMKKLYNSCNFLYCHIDEAGLKGYKEACGIRSAQNPPRLIEQFNHSILKNYEDMINILRKDNISREIPFVNRRVTELDIEGSISQGINKKYTKENFELHVAALNVIRGIFGETMFSNINFFQKYQQFETQVPVFLQYMTEILPSCSFEEKQKAKKFLIASIGDQIEKTKYIEGLSSLNELFTGTEIDDMKTRVQKKEIKIPSLALQNDWQYNSTHKRIEIGALERQLISCNQPQQVRKLLIKLTQIVPSKNLWTVNPSWEVHSSLQSVIMAMPRGFLQDFAFILFGKSREMMVKHDYNGAIAMLNLLKSEIQRPEIGGPIQKLAKLVNYEILFIELCQYFEEWTAKINTTPLGAKCKQFIFSLHNPDVLPRLEVIEIAVMFLLNMNDWSSVLTLDRRIACQLEIQVAIANSMTEIEKSGKVLKKIHRDIWDLVLSMFVANNKSKQLGSNSNRNSPILGVSRTLQPFLQKIRDVKLFNFMISLIAKIHNILKDEPSSDLTLEYASIFTSMIPDQMQPNLRAVTELLSWLFIEALTYYPQNIAWLKLRGDLEFSLGNNESAMKLYVSALIAGTENCTIPITKQLADDQTIRKMIKCTSHLGCYMQSVLLSQFLDDIDYGIAIKNISEKPANFMDAMDSYYHLLWDQTLLEFLVTMLAKKGENNKKLEAISVMANSEINPNNSEEIKREVINIRKSRILRTLAKQYL